VNGSTSSRLARLSEDPVVRVAGYYVLLAAGTALIWQIFPGLHAVFSAERLDALSTGRSGSSLVSDPLFESLQGTGSQLPAPVALAITTSLCMTGAFLLMLPVAWVYILTRQKKGYRQSVVQTLIILPIVVAGVVLLVKNSIALAFSLGGIVAAVSFRNTLRDTKDAVSIFLATGVGLAAGVQVMSAAAVMSFLFNVVILGFWYTDFGRAPAHLEGPRAARRLQRARAQANRTQAFVSQIDREILKSMSPEQLEALASRARKRINGPRPADKPKKPLDTTLRIQTPQPDTAQRAVEAVLGSHVKDWKYVGTTRELGGNATLEYRVRLRKTVPAEALHQELRARLGPQLAGVEST
jgi:uncharacterized membrane protein YhiD involved in acid resistance